MLCYVIARSHTKPHSIWKNSIHFSNVSRQAILKSQVEGAPPPPKKVLSTPMHFLFGNAPEFFPFSHFARNRNLFCFNFDRHYSWSYGAFLPGFTLRVDADALKIAFYPWGNLPTPGKIWCCRCFKPRGSGWGRGSESDPEAIWYHHKYHRFTHNFHWHICH